MQYLSDVGTPPSTSPQQMASPPPLCLWQEMQSCWVEDSCRNLIFPHLYSFQCKVLLGKHGYLNVTTTHLNIAAAKHHPMVTALPDGRKCLQERLQNRSRRPKFSKFTASCGKCFLLCFPEENAMVLMLSSTYMNEPFH